ncbi:MAG: hypothetical protein OXC46_04670 [Thaumarchaeota archaeon]|nr:hypothetical protein [Nitrososphaerota archaeon]
MLCFDILITGDKFEAFWVFCNFKMGFDIWQYMVILTVFANMAVINPLASFVHPSAEFGGIILTYRNF